MKRHIINMLYWLLNKLKSGEYYDFGSPIVSMVVLKDTLVIATKEAVYRSVDQKKFKKIGVE